MPVTNPRQAWIGRDSFSVRSIRYIFNKTSDPTNPRQRSIFFVLRAERITSSTSTQALDAFVSIDVEIIIKSGTLNRQPGSQVQRMRIMNFKKSIIFFFN